MQDHGSIGRMVALVPVTWDKDFPIIGLPGNLRKAPNTWVKPNTGHTQAPKPAFVRSDNFDAPKLNPVWQWNHVPDDTKWSLTEKPGVLRLHSLPAGDFWTARNSLTQRPPGPECVATVELDASGLAAGDTAGLALLSSPYAWIGLVKTAEGVTLQTFDQTNRRTAKAPASPTHLWLRVACNFDTEKAVFSWSADGKDFAPLGEPFTMVFQLTTFQGVRLALFNYNTSGKPGGHADFDNFTVDEPRASGIERTIPVGKTITLTSGADGSFLAAERPGHVARQRPLGFARRLHAQRSLPGHRSGQGARGARRQSNGRFVSAGDNGVVLKDLAGAAPGRPSRSNGSTSCGATRCSCPSPTIATWPPNPIAPGRSRLPPPDRARTARTAPASNGARSRRRPRRHHLQERVQVLAREGVHDPGRNRQIGCAAQGWCTPKHVDCFRSSRYYDTPKQYRGRQRTACRCRGNTAVTSLPRGCCHGRKSGFGGILGVTRVVAPQARRCSQPAHSMKREASSR